MSRVWESADGAHTVAFDGPYRGTVCPLTEGQWEFAVHDLLVAGKDWVARGVAGSEETAKFLCELHGNNLSMIWNVQRLSDEDLTKEIYFAKGFGPNRAGTPEDRWESLLINELAVRKTT